MQEREKNDMQEIVNRNIDDMILLYIDFSEKQCNTDFYVYFQIIEECSWD